MKILILIVGLLIFAKIFLFWLWLWQLKEYRFDRFRAHFDTLAFRKIASGFWRLKLPKFTKKIVVIFFSGLTLATFLGFYSFFALFLLIILAPLFSSFFILSFQLPTALWKKTVIQKAKQKRAKFKNLLVVGITGSYGKTSTKEFLATILSEKFHPVKSSQSEAFAFGERFNRVNVLKTKEHQNTEIGVSQCILNDLKEEHEIFICEMGAYKRGEIKLLCDITKPKIGILTGINEQHMATFGSQENIIKAKFELIESLPEDGVAILNWDNDFIKSKVKSQKSKLQAKSQKFYSIKEKLDVWAEDIKINKEDIFFKASSRDDDSAEFKVNLLGPHNVLNILGAAAVAKELGMNLKEISNACQKIKQEQGGIKLIKGKLGLNILDATYSANPYGVISHLEYLKIWPGKKILIMPCLIELGPASSGIHKRIGKKIGEVCDLAIITTKERLRELRDEAIKSGMKEENILFIENPKEIFEKIKIFCSQGDIILLESRVPSQLISLLVV